MGFSALLDPQNRQVGVKLALATGCMVVFPVVTFLIALHYCQHKESPDVWAGGAAILMTNFIIAVYCYSAFVEDQGEVDTTKRFDDAGPRVGIFKQRVD